MTRPRNTQICVEDTPYYHVVSRCVRRTFLCGIDHSTGRSYEHRRSWIENRIRLLSSIFSVDICAYAVMSNHYHLVLKLCPEQASSWTAQEVVERWTSLFNGPTLIQKYANKQPLSRGELSTVNDCIAVYRNRLASLSWFMKSLNEPIARQANKEDNCSGHFWESRYKSQALLTEEALLSAMCYVDLNPVRAAMAETPEASDYTSIKERIKPQFNLVQAISEQVEQGVLCRFDLPLKPLLAFEGATTDGDQQGLLFSYSDYLNLVDFTGRTVKQNKRGAIPNHLPPILERLQIPIENWLINSTQFEAYYRANFSQRPPPHRKTA